MSISCIDICDEVTDRLEDIGFSFDDGEVHKDVLEALQKVIFVRDFTFEELIILCELFRTQNGFIHEHLKHLDLADDFIDRLAEKVDDFLNNKQDKGESHA